MLFKALIERLLGSDEAQDWKERDRAKTSRFSYDNYPSLVTILLDLLKPNGNRKIMDTPETGSSPLDLHGAEGVFPALQILRQARPPPEYISKMQELVKELIPSPHWHMRDMAARTYVSLCSPNEGAEALGLILDNAPASHNGQHGTLLVVKYLLKKMLRNSSQFSGFSLALSPTIKLTIHSLGLLRKRNATGLQKCTHMVRLEQLSICQICLLRRCRLVWHEYTPPGERRLGAG